MSKKNNFKIGRWATTWMIFVLVAVVIVIQYFWIIAIIDMRKSMMTESIFLAFNESAYEIINLHKDRDSIEWTSINKELMVTVAEAKKHKAMIDNTIEHYMKNNGIKTPYYWAVVKKDDGQVIVENDLSYLKKTKTPVQTYRISSMYYQFPYELLIQFFNNRWLLPSIFYYTIFALGVCFIVLLVGIFYNSRLYRKRQKETDFWMDFIGNMVHEFKTPMATISLASEMMSKPDVVLNNNRIMQYSSVIFKENRHLREMIDKLLQTISLDMDAMTLNLAPVDVHAEILQIAESAALRIKEKEGLLILNLCAEDYVISGDKMHISNVISNLLENAEKYSDENPTITIETKNDHYGLYISVADKGIGISSEHLGKLFNKFYRVRSVRSYSDSGYGLGLYYVAYVVRAHGGNIRVTSKEGKGSTFELFFPYYR